MNVVPRAEYPPGAGLVRSAFTIGRSEPSTDEETWNAIQTTSGGVFVGSCTTTYNQTYVGYKEVTYVPEGFGLVGPLICQDDLTLYWQSQEFWEKYFMALEKRNTKSIVNRLMNVYGNYATRVWASTNGTVNTVAGNVATQPAASNIDLSELTSLPQCGLSQDLLDQVALQLSEDGADVPDSNGWITQGPAGAEYPLLIGEQASNQILLNNAEIRNDYNMSFMGWGDANPVIQRIGASRVIKNFRHIITRFPPRWGITDGTNALYRVPTWLMVGGDNVPGDSTAATKGQVAIVNPAWQNPSIAVIEGCYVLTPWCYTEEILRPVNSAPGMKWTPQDYFGEWRFVTGNDALLGFSGCTGVTDPTHKLGRHFAEYRHALKPVFPDYARLILFQRCPNVVSCVTCS